MGGVSFLITLLVSITYFVSRTGYPLQDHLPIVTPNESLSVVGFSEVSQGQKRTDPT